MAEVAEPQRVTLVVTLWARVALAAQRFLKTVLVAVAVRGALVVMAVNRLHLTQTHQDLTALLVAVAAVAAVQMGITLAVLVVMVAQAL